jgi:hypothetical protein
MRQRHVLKKWFFAALLLAAVAATAGYYYLNKPHRSVADETATLVSADSLFMAFATDEASANARYLNAVLRVEGVIKSVERNTENKQVVVLDAGDPMFGVNCTLEKEAEVKEGQTVVIKGICTGYLADVVITQGLIEK